MWVCSVIPDTAALLYWVCLPFTLSFDEAPLFPLKRKKKVVLVNNPPLSSSKSIGYRVCWFGGLCRHMPDHLSAILCLTSHLGHLCPCKVTLHRRPHAGERPADGQHHPFLPAQTPLALLQACPRVPGVPAKVPDLTSLFGSVPNSPRLLHFELLVTAFLDVRHFGGKLVLSRVFVQPPDPRGLLHMAVMSIP